MGSIKGQPGTKPSSVPAPVTNEGLSDEAAQFMQDFQPPEMQTAAPQGPALSDEASQFLADQSMDAPELQGPSPDQFAEQPGFLQANLEQFQPQNFMDRLRYGMASNDKSVEMTLKQKYGAENVAMKDGDIYYRRDPKEKLRPIDPHTFELFHDLVTDNARVGVQEAAMAPAEVGGGMAAGPAGAIGGRVASVPMANSVADGVASSLGVVDDPGRDKRSENNIGMTAEVLLPVAGNKIFGMISKRIPGTMAYKAAVEEGEKSIVGLTRQSSEVKAAAEALEKEGIDVGLMSHQVHNTSQSVEKVAAGVDRLPEFQAKEQAFAEGYGQALENTVNEIKRSANPTGHSVTSEGITDAVRAADKFEGQTIGMYKAKAMAKLGNKPVPLPQHIDAKVTDAMRELGMRPRSVELKSVTRPGSVEGMANRSVQVPNQVRRTVWELPKGESLDKVAGRLGLTDMGQTRSVMNVLKEYSDVMSRGRGVRLNELDSLLSRMGPLSGKLPGEAGAVLGSIQGDLRTFRRQVIESGLEDAGDKKLFNAAMDKFGAQRAVVDDLRSVIDKNVSTKALVNNFFKAGAAPERINALKTILGTDSPQWGSLKEEFLNQMMLKHAGKGSTRFNSGAMLADIKKNYGEDFVREVLDNGSGPNFGTLKNLLTVGERIEATQRGLKMDDKNQKLVKSAAEGFFSMITNSPYRMLHGVQGILGLQTGEQKMLMEIFNRDGYEKYLSAYKGKNKGELANKIEIMLNDYNAARAANTRTTQVIEAGKDVLKRGTRGVIRNSAQ